MLDRLPTPAATLRRAREIALSKGLHYVYTGNINDCDGGSTYCPNCRDMVIERDWFQLGQWNLQKERCAVCGYAIAGHFEAEPGKWGARRLPVRLKEF